ncbi:MAG: ATP-dependent RecD-like DNA helicase, partial [Syntrophaceae bacterium]|nr:ATP-dependent RecD-like DNA helicase [Syntrophaceae bacterium]
HGVSATYATKIFKHYGDNSIEVVKENPYRLAMDIFGIGFVTADRIAESLGFEKNSLVRAEAGVIYVLNEISDDGHVYFPKNALIKKSVEMLGVDHGVIVEALENLVATRRIVIENISDGISDENDGDSEAVYLFRFNVSEKGVAALLKDLVATPYARRKVDSVKALKWIQEQMGLELASKQLEAVESAIDNKVMVITGGPGTGKTTIIRAILGIFQRLGIRILLAAPTGRAAKRMSEATGQEAKTIHRLLEFSPVSGGFQRNSENPLNCDLIVVDEASMIDTTLMYHLLRAIPPEATFIIVGDVNQLPSVGPGNVLKDIIESRAIPVVMLNEIFRQERDSSIIINAHLVNSGSMPNLDRSQIGRNDFFFIEKDEPEEALKIILELACGRIQKAFGFDPLEDVQILTPMNMGIIGTSNLNIELQKAMNPREDDLVREGRTFRVNDKVMQIRNNYEKEVFNGDIGKISRIDTENQEAIITIDGRDLTYDFSEIDEVVLAYAVSVHKSQGSEYPCVVIPIMTQHYMLLQRNLLYTAITRGKKLVVIVGSKKALAIAVKNNRTLRRYTYLKQRLSS